MTTPVDQPMLTEAAIETIRKSLDEHASRMPTPPLPESLLEKAWLAAQAHGQWSSRQLSAAIGAEILDQSKDASYPEPISAAIGDSNVAEQSLHKSSGRASVESWARALAMTVDTAVSSLRELLAPQFSPPPLGAASGGTKGVLRMVPKAGFYSLTVSEALNEPNVFYFVVQVEEQMVALAKGRSVVVRMGAMEYQLGQIGDDGVAELEIKGPLPTGQSLEVILSPLESDPKASI